jgi:hypothetical protein|tara:strand:+ start:2338 stop:2610 length:273 start_codon:yes stop_codon:yes gene_type:complete
MRENIMFDRSEMMESLQNGLSEVTFNKINGDVRVMTCTLDDTIIPADFLPKTSAMLDAVEVPQTIIKTYDVNAEGWRSFRVENVTNFRTI